MYVHTYIFQENILQDLEDLQKGPFHAKPILLARLAHFLQEMSNVRNLGSCMKRSLFLQILQEAFLKDPPQFYKMVSYWQFGMH